MAEIFLRKSTDSLKLSNELFSYEIAQRSAGFPGRVSFQGDVDPVFESEAPMLSARLDGGLIYPCLKQGFHPEIFVKPDSVRVIFDDIGWQDESGKPGKDYRLALHYEIYEDGVVFVKTFFFARTLDSGLIKNFLFRGHLRLEKKEEANWAYWRFPRTNTT